MVLSLQPLLRLPVLGLRPARGPHPFLGLLPLPAASIRMPMRDLVARSRLRTVARRSRGTLSGLRKPRLHARLRGFSGRAGTGRLSLAG